MVDLPTILFAFLQLLLWLVIIILACSWVANQLLPKNKWLRRILQITLKLIFIEPFKKSFQAIRWLIVKIFTTNPQYRFRQIYLENYPVPPLEFYAAIEEAFNRRQIIGAEVSRVTRLEWHLLSARRIYLLIRFREFACFIGGVPLGTGILISWRYTSLSNRILLILFQVPFLGVIVEKLLTPPTFYRTDTYHAFEQAIRATVSEAVNLLTQRGIRALAENEQRPLLREFYG